MKHEGHILRNTKPQEQGQPSDPVAENYAEMSPAKSQKTLTLQALAEPRCMHLPLARWFLWQPISTESFHANVIT
eukprot:scaffold253804_cov21-Tisochrysis_lutea.AAC.1